MCPESQITYPKLSEQNRKPNELTNGHTHIFLIGREDAKVQYEWGQESPLKYDLAKRISIGRPKALGSVTFPQQKIVTIVFGDNEQQALKDIEVSLNLNIPVILVEGSALTNELVQRLNTNTKKKTDGDKVT